MNWKFHQETIFMVSIMIELNYINVDLYSYLLLKISLIVMSVIERHQCYHFGLYLVVIICNCLGVFGIKLIYLLMFDIGLIDFWQYSYFKEFIFFIFGTFSLYFFDLLLLVHHLIKLIIFSSNLNIFIYFTVHFNIIICKVYFYFIYKN